jgi:hypothetical protein
VTADDRVFTCTQCGGTFTAERDDDEAQAEALALWGKRGDAPGMAIVCDDCFVEFLAALIMESLA